MTKDPTVTASHRALPGWARQTLLVYLRNEELLEPESMPAGWMEPGAAFVTLYKNMTLRGCIGTFSREKELYRTIEAMAILSATRDRRFSPVVLEEMSEIKIEVSVLTDPQAVSSVEEVEIGRDGLIISRGGSRGVFLPKVAVEHQWDMATYLTQTCLKAQLPGSAWRDPDTLIQRFQALVYEEA